MKLVIQVTDTNNCVGAGEEICIVSVLPSSPGSTVGTTTFSPDACVTEGGTVTVFLQDVSNCTVNLTVGFTVGEDGDVQFTPLKSGNIADGNSAGACTPPAP